MDSIDYTEVKWTKNHNELIHMSEGELQIIIWLQDGILCYTLYFEI